MKNEPQAESRVGFGNLSSHRVKGLIPAAVTAVNRDEFVYILRCNWPSLVFS